MNCRWCNKELFLLSQRRKFCSTECSLKFHKKKRYSDPELRKRTVERKKRQRFHKDYGVSYDTKLAAAREQNYSCAICFKNELSIQELHFDHCHKTSKPRKLLCHGCNVGLGMFKDSTLLLEQAIKYLKEFE